MKMIKQAAKKEVVRNAGDKVIVQTNHFDGRTTHLVHTEMTIVKVNRQTLDMADDAGNVVRFDGRKDGKIVTAQDIADLEAAAAEYRLNNRR
jgi:hypothetical protein